MSLHELYDLPRPDWWDNAACRGYGHLRDADGNLLPNPFFPDKGRPGVEAARKAHALCAICPVQDQCADAGKDEMYGIWAGTGRKKRVALRVARRKEIDHGSINGYRAHRRRGDDRCDECWAKWAEHCAAYREAHRDVILAGHRARQAKYRAAKKARAQEAAA